MILKKSKSIKHLYDNDRLTFKEISEIIHRALAGQLNTITDGKIYEKTDGQNLIATFKNGETIIAFGNGSVININELDNRYSHKIELSESYKLAYTILKNVFENTDNIDRYLENGNVWVNMEVINPNTRNVIYYGENPILQFHNFVRIENKQRFEYTLGLRNLINEINTNDIIIPDHEVVFNDRNLENNYKVIGSFKYKLSHLMTDAKINENSTIREYYKNKFEVLIHQKFPYISKATKEHLKNRWGGYNKSYVLNSKTIPEKNYLAEIKKFDETAWKYSQYLKDKLKEIILFAGTHIIKNIVNPMCEHVDIANKLLNEEHESFKNNIINLTEDEQKYCSVLIEIINNIGLDNFKPIEGIVFQYKNEQYKITSGLFTYINQLHGLIKYKRRTT